MSLHLTWAAFVTLISLNFGCGHGANHKMSNNYFKKEESELVEAILADDRNAVGLVLMRGANINARGVHNITPLMFAVDRQRPQAVNELLARGANPNLKADDGASAVFLAVENYRKAPDIMFAVIRGGGDPNTRRPDDDPVIMRFMNDRNCEFIRHMKALGADLDITTRADDPLITNASTARDWDIVWCLIEQGAKFDYEKSSRSPISRSLAGRFPSPDSPTWPYKVKVWQYLKNHGIQVKDLDEGSYEVHQVTQAPQIGDLVSPGLGPSKFFLEINPGQKLSAYNVIYEKVKYQICVDQEGHINFIFVNEPPLTPMTLRQGHYVPSEYLSSLMEIEGPMFASNEYVGKLYFALLPSGWKMLTWTVKRASTSKINEFMNIHGFFKEKGLLKSKTLSK